MLKDGEIVKNLVAGEPVRILQVQPMGEMFSVHFVGINSNRAGALVLNSEKLESLEVIGTDDGFTFRGDAKKFRLYAEAERIRSAYQFDPLFAVNCSIIDPLPHQVEAVYKYLLPLPNIRFLLADDTGAGKTIMAGILIKELMLRGMLERVLIITPGGLTKQWQEDEMGLKFNISFKLVNRAAFQSDPTIFSSSHRLVTSIDFLRSDDILNVVKETSWDMIIVDEAHKLSAFEYGEKRYVSKRYQVLETLSKRCDHLLLLTATPHRGRKDTFRNLLKLLDEDIFSTDSLVTSRIQEVGKNGANKFFIRRLKEQMRDWDGSPLYKERHTTTVLYQLTPDEKWLYDRVTDYLTRRRQEAKKEANIHVSLALMVMQRRLTSSIYAIKRTLRNRYNALKGLLDELVQNPNIWKQRQKLDLDVVSLDDYDEFDDAERESLESIMADPRKFRLFTTAKSPAEIREEAEQVRELVELADSLYAGNVEERKFTKLREMLQDKGVIHDQEKLVIFTEHKDTLDYLAERLSNNGYRVETIHGGKSVDQRRDAQNAFARDAQILIATDAAGEGINLQFCRLLINWDIPWNPNRLEQRMGRIHRYGQKKDVLVSNLVAGNTREGKVLEKLLVKLDHIREQLGDDRVYDVISDIFEDVNLEDIINSTLNGAYTDYDEKIDSSLSEEEVKKKIQEQKERLGFSMVNYADARLLKEHSDERRLQPIYIERFFTEALQGLGGSFHEVKKSIYRISGLPAPVVKVLRDRYHISVDLGQVHFCFDKAVFLEYRNTRDLGAVHYINPGNPVFDSLLSVVLDEYRAEMIKGTILVSPDDRESFFAFFVRSQVLDNRPKDGGESVADETLALVTGGRGGGFLRTSPAKLLDLYPPGRFTKQVDPPEPVAVKAVTDWSFHEITMPQYEAARVRIREDVEHRRQYIDDSFNTIIVDMTAEINDLQNKILLGNSKVEERLVQRQAYMATLRDKWSRRLMKLELMSELTMKPPEVLGCAYVVPLNDLEYESSFGMRRDDEVERIAMEVALDYERKAGWFPEDVSSENAGYDIRSRSPEDLKRYIEVKGRSASGGVMLSENEMNRLAQLGEAAWLYIVIHCKSSPELFRFRDPARSLQYEIKHKGIQYLISEASWREKGATE